MLDSGDAFAAPDAPDYNSNFEYGSLITLDRPLGIFKEVEELKVEINTFALKATGKAFTEEALNDTRDISGRMISEE